MEDIVAVEVTTSTGHVGYFLTWGRIQDPVDPGPVEGLVLRAASKFSLPGEPVSATLCDSLQEAAGEPQFHEEFFGFCQQPIPFGAKYKKWRKRMNRRMRAGQEIAYLGAPGATQTEDNDDPEAARFRDSQRLSIVDAYLEALDRWDEIAAVVAKAGTREDAVGALTRAPFTFDELEANYVLSLPLGFRTADKRREWEAERDELRGRLDQP